MTLSGYALHGQLVALRSSLVEHRWQSRVDQPIIEVFNQLLAAAKELAPEPEAFIAVERLKVRLSAATLLMLVDQVLVAFDGEDLIDPSRQTFTNHSVSPAPPVGRGRRRIG